MPLQHVQHVIEGELFTHYFLCNYRPKSQGSDSLSKSLIRFKSAWPIDVAAWVECSVSELKQVVEPGSLILRALQSDESMVKRTNTGLDKLGCALAEALQGRYNPSTLQKVRETKPLKALNGAARAEELRDVYECCSLSEDVRSIVILDDICTTGTTIRSIIDSVRRQFAFSTITIYTLAFTGYDENLNSTVQLNGSEYHWEPKEGWVVEEDHIFYMALGSLKRQIEANFCA
ncbi:MAG TPA: hypothetical protein VGK59_22565 [Ohtaekwangia sp.]